jgi:hypothetical protein
MVMYTPDEEGRCKPTYIESESSGEIETYYQQRAKELKRLHAEVLDGEISPIGFFIRYQHIDPKDVAARVKLRPKVVLKHMSLDGFKTARIQDLINYARVFDVAVSDFFDFSFIDEDIAVDSKRYHNRLIHQATFKVKV